MVNCGGQVIQNGTSNMFIFDYDQFILDERSKKPLNMTQKPVALSEKLIRLFTSPDDWVLDGLSGTG